ncbi:glycosyl hydrolase [Cladorrhinum sp. PSN332]|nr:glycosyl hydrolase [Cladorrhinum sp. PSN332]
MYYSAQLPGNSSAFHCIGAAVSTASILGPYKPLPSPLACPLSRGGAIDPSGFLDPVTGRRYLVYKVDGNSLGNGGSCGNTIPPLKSTPIMLQRVSETDGVTLVGEPVQILDRDERDGPLVEAPDLWYDQKSGRHVLFYSNHCWSEEGYSVNYAVSDSGVAGNYVKMNGTGDTGERALVMTEGRGDGFNLSAPGGAAGYVDAEGKSGIVFHANCKEGRCLFGAGIGTDDDDGGVYVF